MRQGTRPGHLKGTDILALQGRSVNVAQKEEKPAFRRGGPRAEAWSQPMGERAYDLSGLRFCYGIMRQFFDGNDKRQWNAEVYGIHWTLQGAGFRMPAFFGIAYSHCPQ